MTATTHTLESLLARVREATGPDPEIGKAWCRLWIARDDYPEIGGLIEAALSDRMEALGACITLAERVLPLTADWKIFKVHETNLPFEATIYRNGWLAANCNNVHRYEHHTSTLALLAAILSALLAIAKEQAHG